MGSYNMNKIACLILTLLLKHTTNAAFPCDVSSLDEISLSDTPIGKAFNRTSHRKECIIGCLKFPICNKSPQRKKNASLKVDEAEKENERVECENERNSLKTLYMKGPGWDLYENKDRRATASTTCESLPVLVQGFEVSPDCTKKKHICLMLQTD